MKRPPSSEKCHSKKIIYRAELQEPEFQEPEQEQELAL
jgi:hypothetical protein